MLSLCCVPSSGVTVLVGHAGALYLCYSHSIIDKHKSTSNILSEISIKDKYRFRLVIYFEVKKANYSADAPKIRALKAIQN